jgi:hypothetical protein
VAPPAFDDDLSFPQREEDLAVEQFVSQATSLTPIWRIASAMPWPCETRTSTCRSFVTISSGLCLFLGISVLLDAKRHASSRTTSSRADQLNLFLGMTQAPFQAHFLTTLGLKNPVRSPTVLPGQQTSITMF